MGNTTFYEEAQKSDSKITWRDIFSESWRKHTRKERDYAMTVGTSLHQVSEANMLQTWHKPWLWYPAAKVGLGLIVLLFVVYYGSSLILKGVSVSLEHMFYIVPPIVVPVIVMLFFWELNIPQNISLMELFAYFLGGGILSFVGTSVMYKVIEDGPSYLAAFREEPSKLAASVIILLIFEQVQHKKIYGLTGLVVGGAVGAGFSAFESITYALNGGVEVLLSRILFAIGMHMVFSAPFVAALTLAAHKKGRLTAACLVDPSFLVAFAIGCAFHAAWNFFAINDLILVLLIPVMWSVALYWVRRCLNEAVRAGRYVPGSGDGSVRAGRYVPGSGDGSVQAVRAATLRLTCIAGPQRGQTWQSTGQTILLGRDAAANIRFAGDTKGVSRRHCSVQYTSGGWTVRDLNASYGTFLSAGRLGSGQEVCLRDGECIYLGSKQVAFRVILR